MFLRHREHRSEPVCIADVEQHSLRKLSHHLSRFEVYDEQSLFAHNLVRAFAFLFDSREDRSFVIAEVHEQPDKLVRTFHIVDALDCADAYVKSFEHVVITPAGPSETRREPSSQRDMMQLQQKFVEYNQDIQKKQSELTQPVFQKTMNIIRRLATQEGFDVVVDKKAVPYVRTDLDLTDRVITMYNSGAGGDADKAGPAPKEAPKVPAPMAPPVIAPPKTP